MKFNVSLDLLEEMAECIHISNWASTDEIYAYMKSCVTGSADYDPEDYADGKDPKQPIEYDPAKPMNEETRFVVLGGTTHFTYDPETEEVHCTHGGWGGKLIRCMNGLFAIEIGGNKPIAYTSCVFTHMQNYDAARGAGLID
jgi:hypothetical protein